MKHYSTREAAQILDATEAEVRAYARLGQITAPRSPAHPLQFTFQELLLLKTTRGLLQAGVPAGRVRRVWSSLRRQLPPDLPLTSISIFADGQRAVAWDGSVRWRPDSGQSLLELDAGELAPRTVPDHGAEPVAPEPMSAEPPRGAESVSSTAVGKPAALSAEHWFHLGCELENTSVPEARRAYMQALELDPDFGDAHLNLGRLDHEAEELGKAEAHYREAVRCAPEDATCHFNLGVLLEDRGRPDEAIHAYEQAIARDPDTADAHYNLGLLLEARHRRPEAMRHLMEARRLYTLAQRGR